MPQASRTPLPFSEISHPQARLPQEPTLFQLKPPGQHTYPSWGGAPPSVITVITMLGGALSLTWPHCGL